MADVFDYLYWRADLDFEKGEANEADRLILCMLSFMDFADIVSEGIARKEISVREAITRYLAKCSDDDPTSSRAAALNVKRFAEMLAKSKRFGNLMLSGYQTVLTRGNAPDSQVQFAALTVRFSDHLSVVYRGTDDTLVGWKENFNSDLVYPIPAQTMAAEYLKKASCLGLPIAVQGHSKGGNLAVYAAVSSDIPTERILLIYDYDGPGFDHSFFMQKRYKELEDRICKFVPEYPIIGLIKISKCQMIAVKCSGKGLVQHNGFHWQYTPNGLERAMRIDAGALLLNSRLKRCYYVLPPRERKQFIEGVYSLVCTGGRETLTELSCSKRQLIRDFRKLAKSEKQSLRFVFYEMLRQMISDGEKQKNS